MSPRNFPMSVRVSAREVKRLRSTWADKPARLVHIPRSHIFVIRVRRFTTLQKWQLVRHGIATPRCSKIPARGSDTPGPSAASLCQSTVRAGLAPFGT
jgi:hypothetical protein